MNNIQINVIIGIVGNMFGGMILKKFLVLFLLLTVFVTFSSCSSKTSNLIKENEQSISNAYQDQEKLPQKYTSELARKNGDVVEAQDKIYNIEKLDKFIEEYKNNQIKVGDMIRITSYTTEGDAIIVDLKSVGENMKLIIDITRDTFSSPQYRKRTEYNVIDVLKQNENGKIHYKVKTDKGEEMTLIFVNSI